MEEEKLAREFGPLPESDDQARLQRESFKALSRLLSNWDSLIYRDERIEDFGVDCSLELKVGRLVTNFRTQVQVKATGKATLTQEGYVPLPVDTSNLNLLLNGTCPSYLLWDESTDEFWYTWARDQARRLSIENPSWKDQKKITLQFRTKLTHKALPEFQERILAEGRFHRGLHDLIALDNEASPSSQLAPVQRAFQLLSKLGASAGSFFRSPKPTSPAEFKRLCVELLRQYWSRPALALVGGSGEKDHGLDLLDLGGSESVYGATLKFKKDKDAAVSQHEIESLVERAKGFRPLLGKFGILTTGDFSVDALRRIREVNEAHRAEGLFEVELFSGDKITELLQLNPEVTAQALPDQLTIGPAFAASGLLNLSTKDEEIEQEPGQDEVDRLLDEARDAVNGHSFQLATLLLNRIEQQKGKLLSSSQHFRLVTNRGFATLGEGDPKRAAELFLEALALQPDDEKAKTNEVLAYYLIKEVETAYKKAEELRPVFPSSPRLAAYSILTSPKEKSTAECERELTPELLTDGQVRTALANKALSRQELAPAEGHAKAAVGLAPTEGQPQIILAKVYMDQLIDLEVGRPLVSAKSKQELLELAEKHGYEAARLAAISSDVQTQIEARVLLVNLLLMQGKADPAGQEADKAYQLSPDNVQALIAQAQVRFATDQPDAGIASLGRAYAIDKQAEIAFNYGNALLTRSKDKDLDIAIDVLTGIDMSTVVPKMGHTVAVQALRATMKKQAWRRGGEFLDSASPYLEPASDAALRGLLAHYEGLPKEAESHAQKSKSLLTTSSSLELKVFLARLFMLTGLPAEALPFFKEAFDANMPSFDYGQFLDCAARLGRDGVIIEAFRTLQDRGVDDWQTINFGVQYIQKYDSQEAVDTLDKYLKGHPGDKLALLSRSVIGLIVNRPELVSGKLSELPAVDELPVENIVQVIHVLRFAKEADAAVDYAYRFLRKHFGEANAHRAMLISMTPFEPAPSFPPAYETVMIGAAVRFQEIPSGDPEWKVIEDTTAPSADFDEIIPTSKLAVELLGKQIGETFQLAAGTIERRGKILQIVPKYVRRYNDSGDRWQLRFPDEPMVEAVRLGSTEEEVRDNIEKVLKSLEKRAELEEKMRQTYSAIATPLHIFGAWHGKNAYAAMVTLSVEKGQPVRVSYGTVEERNDALTALRTAAVLVVDLSTLAVLRILGLEKVFTSNRFRFVITESTWRELRETLDRKEADLSPSLAIQFVGGKQVAYEETVEYKVGRAKADKEFLTLIEKHCEIVPVIEVAAYDSPKRETFDKAFGQYGIEAMLLAAKPDYMLWTDDLVQAQFASTEFGARRVWTQTVLIVLAELGIITAKDRDVATAKMIGMEYQITYFDVSAILEAVELTDSKPWESPLKNFVDEFGSPKADLNALFPLLTELVVRLYREPLPQENRCRVLIPFLDAAWKNVHGREGLRGLRANTQRLFGLNVVGQTQFESCFDRWYKLIENPLLPG